MGLNRENRNILAREGFAYVLMCLEFSYFPPFFPRSQRFVCVSKRKILSDSTLGIYGGVIVAQYCQLARLGG